MSDPTPGSEQAAPSTITATDPAAGTDAPLEGIKVVELSMYVQGPVAGLTLASLGADVIKIEQADHEDLMRHSSLLFGVRLDDVGRDWMYASLNRGKRSIALDIKSDEGRPVFEKLIAEADVLVTNLREAGLERMGADPATIHAINPQIVYCRGAGFGLRGPMANDPCQDTVGMAFGGFMDVTATGDTPNYPPGSMSDVLTGTNMASAIMAGLVKRMRTGRGSVVGTSQVQALLWMQLQPVGIASTTGQKLKRFDPNQPSNPLFNIYETADGWIAVASLKTAQWPPMAEALGLTHLLDDPRFATFVDVLHNPEDTAKVLREQFKTNTTDHWWEALKVAGTWVAPVRRTEELATDEHILANEYLVTFPDGTVGPPAPFEVDGYTGARTTAADYGEHTDEVLTALGFSEDDVTEMRIAGAIW